MRGDRRYSTLPHNADKILFAEDLVNHILLKLKLPLLSSGIADHRALIYNGFNSQVRLGADYCFRCTEEDVSELFDDILKENAINRNAFLIYLTSMMFRLSMETREPGAHLFLTRSVRSSIMAGKFYMHGFLDAPVLAVDYIISIINDTDMTDGYWQALDVVAAGYSRWLIDLDKNFLTPESASDYEWESDSLSTSSSKNSEKSRSPDHEMESEDDKDEHQEYLIENNSNLLILCSAALGSYEEPVPSIPDSKHVEKTDDVKADNILSFSDSTSDPGSSGSSKVKKSLASFHSFELSSNEDDCSKQNILKTPNEPSGPHSNESERDVELHETDLETAESMTEKSSAILSSPVNELYESSSSHQLESSFSVSYPEDLNASLMEESDRPQS